MIFVVLLLLRLVFGNTTKSYDEAQLAALMGHEKYASRVKISTVGTSKVNKMKIEYPLESDSLQLFGFAHKITELMCMTVESAALSGWKFQLVGPTIELLHEYGFESNKENKIFVLEHIVRHIREDVTILFVDSFDTYFQDSPSEFSANLDLLNLPKSSVLFNAEQNCFPARRFNKGIGSYCEMVQGMDYITNELEKTRRKPKYTNPGNGPFISGEPIPSLCQAQLEATPQQYVHSKNKYLNSGLSVGQAAAYRTLLNQLWSLLNTTIPVRCQDHFTGDQSWISYLYVHNNNNKPHRNIFLDYNFSLFGNAGWNLFVEDEASGHWVLKVEDSDEGRDTQSVDKSNIVMTAAPLLTTTTTTTIASSRHHPHPSVIHSSGGAKYMRAFRTSRLKRKFGRNSIDYDSFLNESVVYVDGRETRLGTLCGHLLSFPRADE